MVMEKGYEFSSENKIKQVEKLPVAGCELPIANPKPEPRPPTLRGSHDQDQNKQHFLNLFAPITYTFIPLYLIPYTLFLYYQSSTIPSFKFV
jgi:hypothetical protein